MKTDAHHLVPGTEFINLESGVKPDIHESVLINGVIDCSAKVTIERDVFSAHDIMILTNAHDVNQFGEDRRRSSIKGEVYIKEGAWLGTRCIILSGVTIGKHSVVAAGAVVACDVPDYEVWGCVPARFIKAIPH